MTESANLANAIAKVVDRTIEREARKRTTTTGTVTRTDADGTVWVDMGYGPTQAVSTTASVRESDTVTVTVENGKATVTGNISRPSTDDAAANAAHRAAKVAQATAEAADQNAEIAAVAASNAQASADSAAQAASDAWDHADDAAAAASAAQTSADDAAAAASSAQSSADAAALDAAEAKRSAGTANTYANAALDQLGIVQDVAGILQWATEHGSFVPTSDTSVIAGKVYFAYDASTGDYTPVIDPQARDLGSYFELSVSEAMTDFIMAHLAVTSRGLWVLPNGIDTLVEVGLVDAHGNRIEDASGEQLTVLSHEIQYATGYKVLLANDGMYVYDGDGLLVTKFGENIEFSSTRAQYIGDEDAYIVFTPATAHDGSSIVIGGDNVTIGTDKPLSELLEDIEQATSDAAEAVETARDGAFLMITSTNGQLFKNGSESTVLQVAVFPNGGDRCDTLAQVREKFGAGAYIEWSCRHEGGSWTVLASDDPHLSNDGMWLTVSPTDVDVKTTFSASLVTL